MGVRGKLILLHVTFVYIPGLNDLVSIYLEYGEALERGGSELFERQAIVLEIHASGREGDAGGLAATGQSEVVKHGRHSDSGGSVVVPVVVCSDVLTCAARKQTYTSDCGTTDLYVDVRDLSEFLVVTYMSAKREGTQPFWK